MQLGVLLQPRTFSEDRSPFRLPTLGSGVRNEHTLGTYLAPHRRTSFREVKLLFARVRMRRGAQSDVILDTCARLGPQNVIHRQFYPILVITIHELWSREPPCTPRPTDLRRRLQHRRVARRPLCSKGRPSLITQLSRASQLCSRVSTQTTTVASQLKSRPSSPLYYRRSGLDLRHVETEAWTSM